MDFSGRTLRQRSKQAFYLKEIPVALVGEWEGDSERKNASKDCVSKQVSPVGNRSTALLDNSRSQSKMCTSKLSCLRGEGGGIVMHQPVRHWLRLPRCDIDSLTCSARMSYRCQWLEFAQSVRKWCTSGTCSTISWLSLCRPRPTEVRRCGDCSVRCRT